MKNKLFHFYLGAKASFKQPRDPTVNLITMGKLFFIYISIELHKLSTFRE